MEAERSERSPSIQYCKMNIIMISKAYGQKNCEV